MQECNKEINKHRQTNKSTFSIRNNHRYHEIDSKFKIGQWVETFKFKTFISLIRCKDVEGGIHTFSIYSRDANSPELEKRSDIHYDII